MARPTKGGLGFRLKILIYARVSTDKQELDHQIAACRRFCEYKKLEIAEVITDVMSGAKAKRPGYMRLVKELRGGAYDGVVVFRLDRLGRNARELALLIDELENKGIKVMSINESFDTSTAMGRAMREIIMIFAQLEREQISEATKQRLASLKAGGKQLGRPRAASEFQKRKILGLFRGGDSIKAISRKTHLSYGTVWNLVKVYQKRGVSPAMSEDSEISGVSNSVVF